MYLKYTALTAVMAAVSVRRRESPRCTGMKPCLKASAASSFEKSPSGPIIMITSLPE